MDLWRIFKTQGTTEAKTSPEYCGFFMPLHQQRSGLLTGVANNLLNYDKSDCCYTALVVAQETIRLRVGKLLLVHFPES